MTRVVLGLLAASVLAGTLAQAQAVIPFKLGTFERAGRTFVGVVLREAVVIDLLAKMKAGERELLTLYFGNGLTQADAERAAAAVTQRFANLATEIYSGGQQHYHYIFSLE